MSESGWEIVRPSFEKNVVYVKKYIKGLGIDMGCGSCPLLEAMYHVDMSPQPDCESQIGKDDVFFVADATRFVPTTDADYVFSSHMLEDLPTVDDIIDCLLHWKRMIKVGGHIILLLPDMQGGRYPTVAEGGNCSHRIDVGKPFILSILNQLKGLKLVQTDTIPLKESETIDVVFERIS
jgi:hypothetical protein